MSGRARSRKANSAKRPRARQPRRAEDRALKALRAQTERLRLGQATARMIVMDWDVRRDTISWSDDPAWLRGPLPPGGTYPLYRDQVHPEDRERWLTGRAEALSSLEGGQSDYRIVRTDGVVLWLHSQRTVYAGPDGKAARMLVALHDITGRKATETALRESEARFRRLVELSSDWYWEQDAELRFTSTAGPSGGRAGITAEEHVGRRRWELPGTEIVGQTWEQHRALLAARQPFHDVLLKRTTASGDTYFASTTGEPVFDAGGRFAGYRGVAHDVTERERAMQIAREADQRLRHAIEHLGESIAVMDAEDRIVVANRYFRELNGNTRLVEPGRRYEEHLRAGLALGNYPEAAGREEAWLAARLARHRAGGKIEVKRQDGKWLQVTDQRLPDGGMISFALDITARKEAEDRLRLALENLGELICLTDAEDRIVLANRRFLEFNAPVAEHLAPGRRYDEHLRAGIGLGLFPDAVGREEQWLAERMEHRRQPTGPLERCRQDGRWLLVDDQRLPDGGIITFGIEITARKRAEELLRASEARFRTIFEYSSAGIALWGADRLCVAANAAYLRFVGYEAQELVGRVRFGDLTAPDDHEGRALIRRLLDGKVERVERERPYVSKSGDRVWGRTSAIAVRSAGGELQYVVSIVTDITEVRAASARIAQMNADLEERVALRTAELKAAYQELESFSYSVSHDLRAPLRAISGFASILRLEEGDKLSAEGRRHLATVDRNAQRMGRLIDALLALVRTSRQPLAPAPIDMASIARTVCDELAREHPAARIVIGHLPASRGDEALVRQVFANLVGNALKYSARSEQPTVEIGSEGDPQQPVYVVRDNGVGFDMIYANKLFRPFERLHSEIEFEGTGIGLALTHLIVQRHGGRIWAEGAQGKGAVFRFSLAPPRSAN